MSQQTPTQEAPASRNDKAFLTDFDRYLFNRGTHYRVYEKLGAHLIEQDGKRGTHFAVWAPNAAAVSVVGDFNRWDQEANFLEAQGESGIWAGFIPGIEQGTVYKYRIHTRNQGWITEKTDPYGFYTELRPRSGSRVWDLDYEWADAAWMAGREKAQSLDAPISIYECHLGSWKRVPEEGERFLTYRELAEQLPQYCRDLGFTHVELLPVAEHPLDASWGYQIINYFAVTARHGTPQDFMYLVDQLHQAGIGVLLDWVPAHFPRDGHGLAYFDGTHLYEHADPRQGAHQDWGTLIFNYGRHEVSNFLIANALFWLDKYHIDGLRVDAVASMLYLDYSREEGQWLPNQYGGRENIEAIDFLRHLNSQLYTQFPGVMMVAEESTSWPMVSQPPYLGGLGFGWKWDMGWMHDSLSYFSKESVHRKWHQNDLTFRMLYAWHENFILPLSHDEVVHGKGSLIRQMPGDDWQRFANLRLLYGDMFGQPAKKLLFMGGEFAQWDEWYYAKSLDWHLLENHMHRGMYRWIRDLNRAYRHYASLHERETQPESFQWVDCNDADNSVVSWLRRSSTGQVMLVVLNCTPVPRADYRVGVPVGGRWHEVLNSDAIEYGGSGMGNGGAVTAYEGQQHGMPHHLALLLPPLGALFLTPEG